ncbi:MULTISPECIES: putative holin-like toxin [Clostridia]
MHMSTYEVLSLLFFGGSFLVALLAYLDNRNNKRK